MAPSLDLSARSPLSAVGTSVSAATLLRARQVEQTSNLRRQAGSTASWTDAGRLRLMSLSDENGTFNGTCTAGQDVFPPKADAGECASYYPDVTVYCCGGVGGKLIDLEQSTTNDTNGDGVADQDTQVEPACETSNYNEMLLCYKYTAEEHCRSAITGPWGVCHPTAAEWDMTASAASSESTAVAGSTSNSAHRSAGFYSRHSGHGNDVSTLSLAIFVALGTSSLLSVAALSLA